MLFNLQSVHVKMFIVFQILTCFCNFFFFGGGTTWHDTVPSLGHYRLHSHSILFRNIACIFVSETRFSLAGCPVRFEIEAILASQNEPRGTFLILDFGRIFRI